MALTPDDVRQVGNLARLALADDEIDRLTHHLNGLLAQFARLQQLDTTGIPPTAQAVPVQAALREDVVTPSLPKAEALSIGPEVDDILGGFVVPQVLGGTSA